MEKVKIFISGTQDDMKTERDAVNRAVSSTTISKGIRAESAVSQPQSPREWIEQQIQECNIYIGIYSHRYGWIIPGEDISATEYEYNLACKLGKPTLVWIRKLREEEEDKPDFDRQKNFLNRVSDFAAGHLRQVFDNLNDLEKQVADGLGELFTEMILSSRFLGKSPKPYLRRLIENLESYEEPVKRIGGLIEENVEMAYSQDNTQTKRIFPSFFSIPDLPEKFILLGEAGVGKSSLLRYLALEKARTCQNDTQAPIPVFVELWKWGETYTYFIDFLKSLAEAEFPELLWTDNIENLVTQKQLFLILDGLDELHDSKLRYLKDWVSKTKLSIIMSCRTTSFTGIRNFDYPTIMLKPLHEQQIAEYAEQVLGGDLAKEFTTRIFNPEPFSGNVLSVPLADLAALPLQLNILINLYRDRLREIPINRWDMLNVFIKEMWRQDRVQQFLAEHQLAEYSETDSIIPILITLVDTNFSDHQQIQSEDLEKALVISGILQKKGEQLHFGHTLFEDYIRVSDLVQRNVMSGEFRLSSLNANVLVMYAGYNLEAHYFVQNELLRAILGNEKIPSSFLWALGEIADQSILNILFDKYKNANKSDLLIPLGMVASRLPENDNRRDHIFSAIVELLLSPKILNNIRHFQDGESFINATIDFFNAIEAVSKFREERAARAIFEAAGLFFESPGIGAWLFQQACSDYLAKIGQTAMPLILKAIQGKDFHVAIIAASALLQLRYPVSLDVIRTIIYTNTNPWVRFELTAYLGFQREEEVLEDLSKLLDDDGICIWNQSGFLGETEYYLVADRAAIVISRFGSSSSRKILTEKLYRLTGLPSPEKYIGWMEKFDDFSLRRWFARRLAESGIEGITVLVKNLGHFGKNFIGANPAVSGLLTGSDEKVFLPILYDEISQRGDPLNLAWCLYLIGRTAQVSGLHILTSSLVQSSYTNIASGAAYGLGLYIKKHLDDWENVYPLIIQLLESSNSIGPEPYSGYGLGLAQIMPELITNKKSVADKIISHQLFFLRNHKGSSALVALDTLESIYFACARQWHWSISEPSLPVEEDTSSPYLVSMVDTVKNSLSYFIKAGDYLYDDERKEDALACYQRAGALKLDKSVPDFLKFEPSDWEKLCCADGLISYKIGHILEASGQPKQAMDYYSQAVESLSRGMSNVAYIKNIFGWALLRQLQLDKNNIPGMLRVEKGLKASELGKETEEPALTIQALIQTINGYMEDDKTSQAREIMTEAFDIAQNYAPSFARIPIIMNLGMLSYREEHYSDAIGYLEQARTFSFWNGEEYYASVCNRNLLDAYLANGDVDKAKAILVSLEESLEQNKQENFELAYGLYNLSFAPIKAGYPYLAMPLLEKASALIDQVDTEDANQLKCQILPSLAILANKLGKISDANRYFNRAGELFRQSDQGAELYDVLDAYAPFLFQQKRYSEFRIILEEMIPLAEILGKDQADLIKAHAIVSDMLEDHISESMLQMIKESVISASTDAFEFHFQVKQALTAQLDVFKEKNWKDEVEFVAALLGLFQNRETHIDPNNQYIQHYQVIINSINQYYQDNPEQFFLNLMDVTIAITTKLSANKTEWEQELGNLLSLSKAKRNPTNEYFAQALLAFLHGTTSESARKKLFHKKEVVEFLTVIENYKNEFGKS